jgi:hypothetical protein
MFYVAVDVHVGQVLWISNQGTLYRVVESSHLGDPKKKSSAERLFKGVPKKDDCSNKEGTVLMPTKKAEKKRDALMANLGELNRPLRVRPVNVLGRDWWAVDAEDTWPGMVMDLRRLGFESMAWENEVLVREGSPAYEPQMEGPAGPESLKPFPVFHPTIQIQKNPFADSGYVEEYEEDVYDSEDEIEPDEDLLHE